MSGSIQSTLDKMSDSGMNQELLEEFAKGLEQEARIIEALKAAGFEVEDSTEADDVLKDIDCWVVIDGLRVPVSIKAQHDGERYGDMYFEIEAQRTRDKVWEPAWYYTGKAQMYAILQGSKLSLIWKDTIEGIRETQGWHHIRTLSAKRKAYLGGRYRHCDARCGFIKAKDIEAYQVIYLDA